MSIDLWLLIGLTSTGAGWLVSHLSLLVRVVRSPQVHIALRVLSLVPPVTPVLAWMAGNRLAVLVWCVLGMVYLGLWAAV